MPRLPRSQLPEEVVGEDIEQPEEEREQTKFNRRKKGVVQKEVKTRQLWEKTKTSNTQQLPIPDFLQNKYRGELRSRKKALERI